MRPYFREMVWGGRRLQELFNKALPPDEGIGESFELSAYAERESAVEGGELAGWGLQRLLAEFGEQLVGREVWKRYGGRFPLLIKLLDPQQDLSIQVHPSDAYAREKGLEEDGKMEAWFVLHSEGGRVAYGLKEGVEKDAFVEAIEAGRAEEVVQFYPVEAGDVLFIPPGTVHALCSGVLIYEVQQSSDLTFRIYDYDRLGLDGKPRGLHVQEALEVIDFQASVPGPVSWSKLHEAQVDRAVLVEAEHFRLNLYRPQGDRIRHAADDSFLAITMVGGEAEVGGERGNCRLRAGGTALIPAYREFVVEPQGGGECAYLIASVAVGRDESI